MSAPAPSPADSPQDAAEMGLLVRLRNGDMSALADVAVLYGDRTSRRLRKHFKQLGGEDVEDILGNSLLRLWNSRRKLDPSKAKSPWGWFWKIVWWEALSFLKKKSVTVYLTGEIADNHTDDDQPVSNEMWALFEILEQLPQEDLVIIIAQARSEMGDHWAHELSKDLQISANTISVRASRIRDQIRQAMGTRGFPQTTAKGEDNA